MFLSSFKMDSPRLVFLALSLFLFVASCTNNDAQAEFEQRAYAEPEGITRTDQNGNIVGDPDKDDWRSSPFYAGIAIIEPAFPNPILYGTTISIDIDLSGNSFTSYVQVGYFDFNNRWTQLNERFDILEDDFFTLEVNAGLFGSDVSTARGTYRLILFDGNNRVISYGDITVE